MAAASTASGTARPAADSEADDRPRRRLQATRSPPAAASWSSSGSSGSLRRAAASSSSAKNGLPSARAQTDSTSSGDSGPSLSRATSVASSSRVERSQLHREREPAAPQPGGQPVHRVVLAHGVVPPRRDDEHAAVAGRRAPGRRARSSVDPSAQCRSSSTSTTGAVALRRSSAVRTASNRCSCDSSAVPQAKSPRAASPAAGATAPAVPRERRAAQRPERLDEREVGQGGSDEVDAPSGEHGRAAPARPLRQLADQPRLADAGGAGDQRGRAAPGRRSVERLLEPRQLRRPADEPVAGGRRGHRDRLGMWPAPAPARRDRGPGPG